jgi:hypothetical protein
VPGKLNADRCGGMSCSSVFCYFESSVTLRFAALSLAGYAGAGRDRLHRLEAEPASRQYFGRVVAS